MEVFELLHQVGLFRALVYIVRHGFLGFVYGGLKIVVYLPFRFYEVFAGLAQQKGG